MSDNGREKIAADLLPLVISIDDIRADPSNAREGHDLEGIADSLHKYGQRKPIVINSKTMTVEAGNGTYQAAKAILGWEKIAAVKIEDDPQTATGYAIADNRLTDKSAFNFDILGDLLGSFDDPFEIPGIDADFLAELDFGGGNGTGGDTPPQIDKAEELQQVWQVKVGDLWELGPHRLICGDCTDAAVVERVMGGERGRMIFTDPPYGIGKDIENDNLNATNRIGFYRQWTDVILNHVIENAYVYVWGYFDTLSDYWQEVIKPRGDCNFRNFIIWRKNYIQGINAEDFRQFPENYEACLLFIFGQPFQNGPWSTSPNAEYYPEMFEPLRAYLDGERKKMGWDIPTVKKIVGHSDLARDHWFNKSQWSMPTREVYEALQRAAKSDAFRRDYDDLRRDYDDLRRDYDDLRGHFDNSHGFTDLWEFDKLTTTELHPTVKPVEVCERGIKTTSQKGEIIIDCFLGSGSTLLAAQNLGRIVRAVEIDPKYVSVTLQRFLDHTGIEPQRVSK